MAVLVEIPGLVARVIMVLPRLFLLAWPVAMRMLV